MAFICSDGAQEGLRVPECPSPCWTTGPFVVPQFMVTSHSPKGDPWWSHSGRGGSRGSPRGGASTRDSSGGPHGAKLLLALGNPAVLGCFWLPQVVPGVP